MITYTTRTVRAENPHFEQMGGRYNPQMKCSYEMGAQVIGMEATD